MLRKVHARVCREFINATCERAEKYPLLAVHIIIPPTTTALVQRESTNWTGKREGVICF